MLYNDSFIIAPKTLILLKELMNLPQLNSFNLVGGTALALKFGHRNSIDIDLFTTADFDVEELLLFLSENYIIEVSLQRKNTLLATINNIKTDFVAHQYPLLFPFIVEDGIRSVSIEDIAAMKINAIVRSGKRLKDFIDFYFLLERFTLNEMLVFFNKKYEYFNSTIALKALNYFEDIDPNIDPPKLLKPLPINVITTRIREATLKMNKRFS